MQHATLVCEMLGDESYVYCPIGQHVVAAPGVCGGRPTFKYTRLEVGVVLDLLASGWTVADVMREYAESRLTPEAITEAIQLAKKALVAAATVAQPTA